MWDCVHAQGAVFTRARQAVLTSYAHTQKHRIARWDGGRWHAMGDLNGDVMAIATFGEYVFAGGDFTTASGVRAHRIARYYAGYWQQVDGGVDGTVFALMRKSFLGRECGLLLVLAHDTMCVCCVCRCPWTSF